MAELAIRAVTLHHGAADFGRLREDLESAASSLLEAVDRARSRLGLRPTYVRVALPGVAAEELAAVARALEGLPREVMVSVGGAPIREELAGVVVQLASSGVYVPLLMRERTWAEARAAARMMIRAASEEPERATKLAVNALGAEHFVTPYFPLASAVPGREAVSVALTYPTYLLDAYKSGGLDGLRSAARAAAGRAEEYARAVAEEGGYEEAYVDLSVSPWMEDSTLGLVEAVAGVRMPRPGFTMGVRLVNEAVAEAARGVASAGFNEVMLPLAEDSKLKARASEGDVTARYLAMLSGVCVAGLDMVPVPADEAGIAGLILDVASYASAKGRALGARIIPVEGAEPGDKVDLGRFGEAPVIQI